MWQLLHSCTGPYCYASSSHYKLREKGDIMRAKGKKGRGRSQYISNSGHSGTAVYMDTDRRLPSFYSYTIKSSKPFSRTLSSVSGRRSAVLADSSSSFSPGASALSPSPSPPASAASSPPVASAAAPSAGTGWGSRDLSSNLHSE